MNSFMFIGRMGADPELRYLQDGTAVCNFRAATDAGFGKSKCTLWLKCTVWGARGETIEKHFSKGSRISVTGELSESEWTDRDGNKRTSLEVKVHDFGFIDRKGDAPGPSSNEPADFDQSFTDDDIPF